MEHDEGPRPDQEKTCATCRFAATMKRPKIMGETGFDDQLMFDDVDETVYSCRAYADSYSITLLGSEREPEVRMEPKKVPGPGLPLCEHAGKDIGLVPISCSAWAPTQNISPEKKAELDALEARYAARMQARGERKDRE